MSHKSRRRDCCGGGEASCAQRFALADALLNWPARVSGLIAADLGADPHLVQTVLQQHITNLLTEAANRFDPPGIGGRSDG